jgi:glycerol-3-phosphate dehydrogenase
VLLKVLLKDPSEISRKDEIWEGKSGLLTIAGGKLTGYRHMEGSFPSSKIKGLTPAQVDSISSSFTLTSGNI